MISLPQEKQSYPICPMPTSLVAQEGTAASTVFHCGGCLVAQTLPEEERQKRWIQEGARSNGRHYLCRPLVCRFMISWHVSFSFCLFQFRFQLQQPSLASHSLLQSPCNSIPSTGHVHHSSSFLGIAGSHGKSTSSSFRIHGTDFYIDCISLQSHPQ